MKIIAVTGGIGSGKSTVSGEFAALGAEMISADAVSHEIMLPGGSAYEAVVELFGCEILDTNGEIDRARLAEIVFSDADKLNLLNTVTHRLIYEEIQRRIDSSAANTVCLEIPLLFSAKCPISIDASIAVTADKEIRLSRVIKRDGCTKEQALSRMARQLSDEELAARADFVIENNGDIEALKIKTAEIWRSLGLK
ncbi:MAG: dephospho-CoA kinase [Monoglobaceae bacterium]